MAVLFSSQGCPSALSTKQRNDLFHVIDQAPEMFLDEILDWISYIWEFLIKVL